MVMSKTRVYVAGHNGMVGSALVRQLKLRENVDIVTRSRGQLDLTCQADVLRFFTEESIDQIYLAAARVGGIHANNAYPAEFIYENLMIQNNIIHSAHINNIDKLLFLGSSCIYPQLAPQPMSEEALLTGLLEPTNEPYAVAKIAGIKLCESYNRQYGRHYRSVMPTNLYGDFDNFHPKNSHVIPALIGRFHEAKLSRCKHVVVWGSGSPRREFLHVDDMASASIHVMEQSDLIYAENTSPRSSYINVGSGVDYRISELAVLIKDVVGYEGDIIFDDTKEDGAPQKLLDITRLHRMGWESSVTLKKGLDRTYKWFLQQLDEVRH